MADWNATGVKLFPSEYERAEFCFIPPTLRVARIRSFKTEVVEGAHDKIRPIYGGKVSDRGIFRDPGEWT